MIWSTLWVIQPNEHKIRVSLKMPEPHRATLGMKRVAVAMGPISLGCSRAKVRNKAQMPVKEITAKIKAVGSRVSKQKREMKPEMADTMWVAPFP
jgi:hypothetical protein